MNSGHSSEVPYIGWDRHSQRIRSATFPCGSPRTAAASDRQSSKSHAVEHVVERVERQLVWRSVGCDVEVAVSDRHACSSEETWASSAAPSARQAAATAGQDRHSGTSLR